MSFTVHGIDGVLDLIAFILFLVATVVAWVAPGHRAVMSLIAAGLALVTLTTLVK